MVPLLMPTLSGSERLCCPLCHAEGVAVPTKVPGIAVCPACGGGSLFPGVRMEETAALYQEDYYQEGSGSRFLGWAERAAVWLKYLRVNAIIRRAPGSNAILDVGCGRGEMLEQFQKQGWRAVGTQLSRTASEAARAQRKVDVRVGEMVDCMFEDASFDVVTFFHVLEHLPEPAVYLHEAHRVLRDQGLLVVEVPDFSSLGFKVLGTRDLCFDYPHHVFFFTLNSLENMLGACGFQVEAFRRFSLEYSPFTTLQNFLNLLPGKPNRFYLAIMGNPQARVLRSDPYTWLHAGLALLLAVPAFLVSLAVGRRIPGNTLRVYARRCASGQGDGRG